MNRRQGRAARRRRSHRSIGVAAATGSGSSRWRRARPLLIAAGVTVLLAAVIVGVVIATRGGSTAGPGVAVATLPASHSPPYTYNSRPPTSGPHLPVPAAYGFHNAALVPEAAVHNMEHGAVVIWFKPGDPALATQVQTLVGELGSSCLVAGPYGDTDTPLAATAWGRLLALQGFDASQLRSFVAAYRSKLGPEAGVCLRES